MYYNVDYIHTAIYENKQIKFHYAEWTVKKKLKLKKNGAFYVISLWALTCDDENYYFVQDRYKDLYRIDKKTKEKKKIDTEVGDFVVVDKYLYYSKDKEDGTLTQIISDTDGNIINEINALEEFGGDLNMYTISYYDGKIYCDILEREDKTYIIEMSLDGSEIKKYEVRD